jgi:hypothetical protein
MESRRAKIELPDIFDAEVRADLIQRAVLAENSMKLQPQGHYPSCRNADNCNDTMEGCIPTDPEGIWECAIRPRQKLGGGVARKGKVIPSSVKGKRAHPHLWRKLNRRT